MFSVAAARPAPLGAAEVWNPTDKPESVAALGDLGPTRWKDSNGDIWYISLYGPQVTDDALRYLKGLSRLTSVDLIHSRVTNDGLVEIAKLPRLVSINLKHTAVGDAGLTHLTKLKKNLRGLNLTGTKVTDAGLAKLAELAQLQNLDLADTQVTDAGLAVLKSLDDVVNLSLDGTSLTDAALVTIAQRRKLRSLSLARTKITDVGLERLIPILPQLTMLDLSGTAITDAGAKRLAAMGNAGLLALDGAKITDAGLESLAELKQLRDLSLANTATTADGIAKLQSAIPHCRIQSGAANSAAKGVRGPGQIVVAADAHPAVIYAAEEFQRYYEQATGAQLPIVNEGKQDDGGHVYVGLSDALAKSPARIDAAGLGPEDLRIRVRGPEIALVGGGPRGTLYSVYTYLENVLGIRFLTAEHTHVPKVDPSNLPRQFDKTFHPPLAYRFVYYKQNMRDPQFGVRMRNNVYGGQERFGGTARSGLVGHSMEQFVPTKKYGKTHPEYFALVDGKRRADVEFEDSTPKGTQLCLTHPDVRRLIVTGVLEALKKNPKQELISVGHSDNYFYCHCPACEAVNDREASSMGTMLQVVNEVAVATAKDYPNTYIGTYAYQITRRPPKHLRPRPNVVLQFATIEACQMHGIPDPQCPRNAELFADLKAWQGLTRQLFLWNYNTVFPDYMLPCPNLFNVEPNVRLFAEVGSQGAFMQCCAEGEGTDLAELRNYLICNLMWDPARSGEKLIDEFLTLHYGPAAGTMRRWIDLTHDKTRLRTFHSHPFGGPEKYGITPQLGEQGIAMLDEAIAAADDPMIRQRLERVLVSPLRATIGAAVAVQRGNHDKPINEQKPLDSKVALALRPNVERFYGICEKYGATHVGEARPIAKERSEMAKLFADAGAPLKLSAPPASGGR